MSDWVRVTLAERRDEADQIRYGLDLRGIEARIRKAPRPAPEPLEIVVAADDAPKARGLLPAIWEAVLELPRAIRPDGTCPFCGYDTIGTPANRPCPECGVDLSSIEARRAYRDGRRPRALPDP